MDLRGFGRSDPPAGGSTVKEACDKETVAAFSDSFTAPDHAGAAVQVCRVFNFREFGPIAAGRYEAERLTSPTPMLFGEDDFVLRPTMLDGYRHHADQMRVELVA
jgi:hypothetical protein